MAAMENDDHEERNCPNEPLVISDSPADLARGNHHFHDSLGCPHTCTGNHNHPVPGK